MAALNFKRLSPNVGFLCGATNVGVISTSRGIYLVDSGCCDSDGRAVLDALSELFPGKKVAAILNTHSHADHCGANPAIEKETGAEIWASPLSSLVMQIPQIVGFIYCGGHPTREMEELSALVMDTPSRPARTIGSGKINLDEVALSFTSLSGHFFDSIGIIAEDLSCGKRTYFLGDSFFGVGLLKKSWIPFMTDPSAFREGVRSIESSGADFFVPSHGADCDSENVHAVAELNVMVTIEFELLILRCLGEGPLTRDELLKRVCDFSGIPLKPTQVYLIGTTLQSYLASMEREGRVEYLVRDNLLLWGVKR